VRSNLANILTGSRFVLAPFFAAAYGVSRLSEPWGVTGLVSMWMLIVVIELTDLLDGFVARTTGTISDIGKVLDPYADVFARLTYFACMVHAGTMPLWFLLVVIYRELGVILIRMLLLRSGVAMGAKVLGKLKSTFYGIAAFCSVLVYGIMVRGSASVIPESLYPTIDLVATMLYIVTAALSLSSLVQYSLVFLHNRTKDTS
jgi:CDP-diacylglycerol--glycerol-3-phosphate 3-phosphatidyltransferase